MSPHEIARAVRLRLAAELADDRAALDRLARAIEALGPPAEGERGEWMRGLALAFEVERYYTAVEATMARVLRGVDGDVPTGPGSHQEILRLSNLAVAGIRPAVVTPSTAGELRELLKFRHLARPGYDVEPSLPRMVEHGERVGRVHPRLLSDLSAFETWLSAQGEG